MELDKDAQSKAVPVEKDISKRLKDRGFKPISEQSFREILTRMHKAVVSLDAEEDR